MTLYLGDRAFETSTTQGTGVINLNGPVMGFVSFVAAVGSGKKVPYIISDNEDWETGWGTVTAGTPDTLTRTNIRRSSNSGAAVDWGPGTRNVRLGLPAAFTPSRDENLNFVEGYGTGGGTANAQTVTFPIAPLAYSDGMEITYYATVANTGAMTINVNSLGAKTVKIGGEDLPAGLIQIGDLVKGVYRSNVIELFSHDIKQDASETEKGVVEKATAAEVATETADKYPDASLLKNHPGIAKAGVRFDGGASPTVLSSHNVQSVVKNGVGDYSINFFTPMANSNYRVTYGATGPASLVSVMIYSPGGFRINTTNSTSGVLTDIAGISCEVHGDM